jgi:hypothetical protein
MDGAEQKEAIVNMKGIQMDNAADHDVAQATVQL